MTMSTSITRLFLIPLLLSSALLMSACAGFGNKEVAPEIEFNVRSASVLIIRQNLASRHEEFSPHYQSGSIGLTEDGMIAVRDASGIAAEIRVNLLRLVMEENKDRETMYREIARANGRPDWETRLQFVFGARWIQHAPRGWYIRDGRGRWTMKETQHDGQSSSWLPSWFPGR